MKPFISIAVLASGLTLAAAAPGPSDDRAIVHVLNRVAFGPRAGDVDRVKAIGLQRYIDQQLHPERIPDTAMSARLSGLTTIGMSSREIAENYAMPALEARRERKEDAKEYGGKPPNASAPRDPQQERANRVMIELGEQKMLRAIYSERQLQEVLTDFWFNHFNIDARKGPDR